MVRRITILALLLSVLFPLVGRAQRVDFVIVTRTGAQIPVRGTPRFEKNTVKFYSLRGTPLVMNVINLDVGETERINGIDLPYQAQHAVQAMGTIPFEGGMVSGGERSPASRTITNSDLKTIRLRPGSIFVETGEEAPKAGTVSQAVERTEQAQPLDEAEWRTKARAISNRRRDLERRRSILQTEAQRLERGMLGVDASATQKLGAELDRVRQDLAGVEQELASVEGQSQRLQQEARRAGVPESWLR